MKRLEFHISYCCSNDCIFCCEHDRLKKFRGIFVSSKAIIKKMKDFHLMGFKHVAFIGGEPTIHPDFNDILISAKALGYRTYVTSNGCLFRLKDFCKKNFPYLDEVCFSVHGHNASLHNFHTRNKQSFRNILMSLNNLEKMSEGITGFVNTVITKYNVDSLVAIINFVSKYKKIKQITISNPAPEGNGLHNFKELVVYLKKIRIEASKAIELAGRKSLTIRFFGVPLCILQGKYECSNDAYWSGRLTVELGGTKRKAFFKETLSYKPIRNRIQPLICSECLANEFCGGVFNKYYSEYGGAEISPLNSLHLP